MKSPCLMSSSSLASCSTPPGPLQVSSPISQEGVAGLPGPKQEGAGQATQQGNSSELFKDEVCQRLEEGSSRDLDPLCEKAKEDERRNATVTSAVVRKAAGSARENDFRPGTQGENIKSKRALFKVVVNGSLQRNPLEPLGGSLRIAPNKANSVGKKHQFQKAVADKEEVTEICSFRTRSLSDPAGDKIWLRLEAEKCTVVTVSPRNGDPLEAAAEPADRKKLLPALKSRQEESTKAFSPPKTSTLFRLFTEDGGGGNGVVPDQLASSRTESALSHSLCFNVVLGVAILLVVFGLGTGLLWTVQRIMVVSTIHSNMNDDLSSNLTQETGEQRVVHPKDLSAYLEHYEFSEWRNWKKRVNQQKEHQERQKHRKKSGKADTAEAAKSTPQMSERE